MKTKNHLYYKEATSEFKPLSYDGSQSMTSFSNEKGIGDGSEGTPLNSKIAHS